MVLDDEALDAIGAEIARAPQWFEPRGTHALADDEWGDLRKRVPLIDPAKWHGTETPEREWLLDGWIPHRQGTYLTGPGSAGKSLVSQQLATCTALGLPFMGVPTRTTPSIYLSCEDDADELHRRQKAICAALGVSLQALSGKLFLVSLAGEMSSELCAIDAEGTMRPTDRYSAIEAVAKAAGVGFVALDNVAHLFSGNENIRHDVAAFVSLLNRLAIRINGAVLLIGHPNKAGDSFSGSTAWENQVRSRLFLETPGASEGDVRDRDARVLSRQKSNYAQNGETLAFRWHQWAFVREDDLPGDQRAEIAANITASAANARFLECLDKATAEKRATSPNRTASNYAPRLFATMPSARGMKLREFEGALDRLLHLGDIINGANVYQRDNRAWVTGLGRAPTLAPTPAQTICTNLHQPSPQVIENAYTEVHALTPLYTTYIEGAANGAAAPSPINFAANEIRKRGQPILAPGETGDEPIEGFER